jgi:CheY-like chemotaxis protein
MTIEPPITRVLDVLLIEDSQMDVNLVRTAFARSDRHTSLTVFGNGEEALSFLHQSIDKSHLPDLIILDLILVGLDGWDILKACKTNPYLESIPVAVFTSTSLADEIGVCYALGADQVVTKPLELTDFLRAVQGIEDWARKKLNLGGN